MVMGAPIEQRTAPSGETRTLEGGLNTKAVFLEIFYVENLLSVAGKP